MVAVPESFEEDFEQAYRHHYSTLHRRSRRWLPADEAEDAVQETFLRAWAHHRGRDPGIPWLLTVLRNLAIDRSRRRTAQPVGDLQLLDSPDEHGPESKVVALEDRRAVRDALHGLTESQRRVIHLREWEELSHQEIADSLGTTIPSVESLLVRGRRRLRGALESVMAVALWPTAGLWRRMRALAEPAAASAGSVPTISTITQTVAQFATAAAVIVAGVATAGSGGGDASSRDVRSPVGGGVPATSDRSPSEGDKTAAFTLREDDRDPASTPASTDQGSTGEEPTSGSSGTDEQSLPQPTAKPGSSGEVPSELPDDDGGTSSHPDPPAEDPEVPEPGLKLGPSSGSIGA